MGLKIPDGVPSDMNFLSNLQQFQDTPYTDQLLGAMGFPTAYIFPHKRNM
ncbi:hypothetical protein R5R49_08830 [Oenococcus oeni]